MLENFALSKEKNDAKFKHRYLWGTALGIRRADYSLRSWDRFAKFANAEYHVDSLFRIFFGRYVAPYGECNTISYFERMT